MSTLKELLGDKWVDGIVLGKNTDPGLEFRPKYVTKSGYYYGLKDGMTTHYSEYSQSWKIIKPTKKITLFRYTYKLKDGEYHQSWWQSLAWEDCIVSCGECLKTESKEIEIEG